MTRWLQPSGLRSWPKACTEFRLLQSVPLGMPSRLHAAPLCSRARTVKVYYDNASLLVDLLARTGIYERVQRRPLFHHDPIAFCSRFRD